MRRACRIAGLASACALLMASPALADRRDPSVDFSLDRGLRVRFPRQDLSLRLTGRLDLGGAVFDADLTPIDDDFEIRRSRLALDARFRDDWRARIEYDFSGFENITGFDSGWLGVWLGYEGFYNTRIRLGNDIIPFGLEETTSSAAIVFAERAMPSALTPSYGLGLTVRGHGNLFRTPIGRSRFTYGGGIYTEPFADSDFDRHKSEHVGVAGRATFAPLADTRSVIQFGGSAEYRKVLGGHDWRVSVRPEASLAPSLYGRSLNEIANVTNAGAEAAAQFGPLLVQGEYLRTFVERQSFSRLRDPEFDGAYAQLSWVVTGEQHQYSKTSGTFGRVSPVSRFGALELAARWSWIDVTDSGVRGGEAQNITAGVGWWVRENVRILFNYVHVDGKNARTLLDDDPQIFQFRAIFAI